MKSKNEKPNYYFSCFIEPVIRKAKGNNSEIRIVEVGAYNGLRYSVGYFFERFLNSKVLNIEPVPSAFEQLLKNRPNSININSAIGYSSGSLKLHISGENSSTATAKNEFIKDAETIEVNIYPLSKLIKKSFKNNEITAIILDVEGMESEVIEDLIKRKVESKVLVVENDTGGWLNRKPDYAQAKLKLEKMDYLLLDKFQNNDIFILRSIFSYRLKAVLIIYKIMMRIKLYRFYVILKLWILKNFIFKNKLIKKLFD